MMYLTRQCETVNMFLRHPKLWNEGMMEETLRPLSDAMKKEESVRKDRRIVRILMAKLGDGYAEAMMTLTFAFRDSGYEVIYTDIQRPEAIVASAIQECVDHIGITT
ncbi:MAG: hypothetical protein ACXU9G_03255, partial [Syntrophales bacterium]